MKLTSLSDLEQLLPEKERGKQPVPALQKTHDGKENVLRVFLDTKGRKGKSVTVVSGLQHNPDVIESIAKTLKQFCGAGGTVKGKEIEIQGDQRDRITEKLRSMNYNIK